MVGEALGRTTLAEEVAADTQATIDEAAADNPELEGASLIYGYLAATDLSTVGIYAPEDPRVSLLRDFGMVDAPAVAGAIKPGEFYGTVSAERAADLDSDVFLTWVEKPGNVETFANDKLLGQIPAIADGHCVRRDRQARRHGVHQPDAALDPGRHRATSCPRSPRPSTGS